MLDVRLFDTRELRRTLGTFVAGVTVVTTTDEEGRFHGVTANSFSSVSLDPPLILWSQAVKSQSHPVFLKAERFAVNILAADQIELSNRFAKSSQGKVRGSRGRCRPWRGTATAGLQRLASMPGLLACTWGRSYDLCGGGEVDRSCRAETVGVREWTISPD
jgi:flavin reductase (DIM6/NTAB) family NADH-FMN oxidoreductase RutF